MNGKFFGLAGGRQSGRRAAGNQRNKQRRRSVAGRFEPLESRKLLTVTYQGGALLTNVEAQAVYLGSDWTSSSLKSQEQSTDQFLSTLVGGSYMDMLTNAGYGVGRGTASAGVVDNVSINKSVDLTDAQIQSDLATLISNSGVQAPDANRLYMVYVEPGVVVQMGGATSQTSFLGYHGAFADGSKAVHYAVMPAPGSPNPTPSSQGFSSAFNELTSVSSHELAEAVTDPNVNYSTMGWYDFQLNGEIGDLAVGHESTITGANGVQYQVQDVVNQNDQIISPASTQPTPAPNPNPGLSAPSLTASAVSTTAAQLSWTAVSGTQGYRVYQVNGGQATLLGTVSSSTTSVQVTGLTPGATESFKVEAFNSTSVADSSVVSVTMPAPAVQAVTAPVVTAFANSSTSVVLSWGAESQATGYNIYWSDGYNVVQLGTVGASTTSVTVTGLQPGSSGYFLVEAFNNVSYADSQWVYAATPYYSAASNGGWGAYAEAQSNLGGGAPSMTPGVASGEAGSHWGRGHHW